MWCQKKPTGVRSVGEGRAVDLNHPQNCSFLGRRLGEPCVSLPNQSLVAASPNQLPE